MVKDDLKVNQKYVGVTVRFDSKCFKVLDIACKLRSETKNAFIRRVILQELARLSFLDSKTKKALGISCG